jgi:hypothetical protein
MDFFSATFTKGEGQLNRSEPGRLIQRSWNSSVDQPPTISYPVERLFRVNKPIFLFTVDGTLKDWRRVKNRICTATKYYLEKHQLTVLHKVEVKSTVSGSLRFL